MGSALGRFAIAGTADTNGLRARLRGSAAAIDARKHPDQSLFKASAQADETP
jgi:hypothetical protein